MTAINLDFGGVDAAVPFEVLPTGPYGLVIENAQIKPAKKEGSAPNLNLQLGHEDGKHKVFHLINLGEASRPWLLQFLQGIYQTPPSSLALNSEEECNEWCASLIGLPVAAVVRKTLKKDANGKALPDEWTNVVDCFQPYTF